MAASTTSGRASRVAAWRPALLAVAAACSLGAWAQDRPAVVATAGAVPTATATPVQPLAAVGADNAEQLGQNAALIARLRQQQAVVEAQAALAKANAELARIQQGGQAPTAVPAAEAIPVGALGTAPRRNMRLLGVSGTPQQRVATLELSDGSVREVRAGSVVGNWTVQEVRLSDVVLNPRGRTGMQLTLRDNGSARETPYTAPAAAVASRSRKP